MTQEIVIREEPTFIVKLYMAGSIEAAKIVAAKYCKEVGLWVNIQPTTYVHSDGIEEGFVIEFLNYPKHPTTIEDLVDKAETLGSSLIDAIAQYSVLIVTPGITTHFTSR